MIYRIETEVEVPDTKCPVHQDTIEKLAGQAIRKAIKGIHRSSAKLLCTDVHILDEDYR